MTTRKINVLVVEDSPVVRMLLTHVLNADPRIEVLGCADGRWGAGKAIVIPERRDQHGPGCVVS